MNWKVIVELMSWHLPGGNEKDAVRIGLFTAYFSACSAYYSALKMEAVYRSETFVSFHCTKQSQISDEIIHHIVIYLSDLCCISELLICNS
jgi:hypothetical protein